jgi:hypothetical protein
MIILNTHCGESFDSAQDREPVERLVEPFDICDLLFGIFCNSDTLTTGRKSYAAKDELRWSLRLFCSTSTVLL